MKEKNEKVKKLDIFEVIVLLAYISILLITAFHHEYNEDESQSWLIARDLNPVEIIEQMKYEGHSVLWYYILFPFAKLGFPAEIQSYISCAFAIATAVLILKKSPFNKFLKTLLTFSSGMIYFYSIIARPYCMIPFLLACISVLYKNKEEHPYIYATLVGLLANTHLIMLPTSILLIITFWGKELIIKYKTQTSESKKRLLKSFLLASIFVLMYGLIIISTLNNSEIVTNFSKVKNASNINITTHLIKTTCRKMIKYFYGANEVPKYYTLLVLLVIVLCIIGTKRNLKQALIFWSQFIFIIFIHSFFWTISITRIIIIIYTLMFWLWNFKEDSQYKKRPKENLWIQLALVILILILCPISYKIVYQDNFNNVSSGKVMAKYIKENIPKNACFICSCNELQQTVAAYLPRERYKFYMPNSNNFVTFNTWDKNWNSFITTSDIDEAIDKLKNEYSNLYILHTLPMSLKLEHNIELEYGSSNELISSIYFRNDNFYIYKVNQ